MKAVSIFVYNLFNKSRASLEEKAHEALDNVMIGIMKMALLAFLTISSILMFSMSLVILLFKIGQQLDSSAFLWTPSMTMFLVICLASTLPLIYVKGKAKIRHEVKKAEKVSQPPPPPIEETLSSLVMDFVNARKEARAKEKNEHPQSDKETYL